MGCTVTCIHASFKKKHIIFNLFYLYCTFSVLVKTVCCLPGSSLGNSQWAHDAAFTPCRNYFNAEMTTCDILLIAFHVLSPDFHSLTVFAKSPTNAQNGGKSVLIHVSDSHAVWIIKDAIRGNRRCPWNIWHVKYLDHQRGPSCRHTNIL